jgi:D-alanyl-D-alanine carboxypeptidase
VGPGLKAGQIFSVKNILYAALVESNNPAAYALSEPMGTDIFVGKMNEKAQQLGMGSTYFKNPVGYLGENYSTAQDVAKLGFGLVKNYPQILQITSVPEYNIFTYDGKFDHTAKSTDELIADPSVPWRNFIIGGKTGDNELAGKCLMIVIKSPDNLGYIVSVVLGSENRFSDMEKIINPLFKGYYEPR